MKSIPEALATMMPAFEPVGLERVSLLDAQDRFLAETVEARFDSPPFGNSAMDGYAVRAAELEGASPDNPVRLPAPGESKAGAETVAALGVGTAMRIFTGARLPEGADAVVMQEDTRTEGDQVAFHLAPPMGHHIRRQGEDVESESLLLERGVALGPGEVGLLASQGHASVAVYRRPVVSILSTGDELRDISDPPRPGSIVNSNAYALAAQVLAAGALPRVLPTAPDDLNILVPRLRDALRADLVISSGGVSVGNYDLMHVAFEEVGVEAAFWKVRVKPGKPIAFGTAGHVPVVGLPGNPVSSMVTFELFVRPGIRRMLGDPRPFAKPLMVHLAGEHTRKAGRTELARARLELEGRELVAHLHSHQGSGSLTSVATVDALVILPAEQSTFTAGEALWALPFGPGRGTDAIPPALG